MFDCLRSLILTFFLQQDLSYKDRHWHEFCFKCCECQNSLVDQPFAPKNDNIYCSDCHDKNFAARCDGCGEPFRGGNECIKSREKRGYIWNNVVIFHNCIRQSSLHVLVRSIQLFVYFPKSYFGFEIYM